MSRGTYELGFLNHTGYIDCTHCGAVEFTVIDRVEVLSTHSIGYEVAVVMKCDVCGEIYWNHEMTDDVLASLQLQVGEWMHTPGFTPLTRRSSRREGE